MADKAHAISASDLTNAQASAVEMSERPELTAVRTTPGFPLFSPRFEFLQMAMPILFLIAASVEIAFSVRFFTGQKLALNFINNVIFLNSVHVIFTFLIIFAHSGGRNWFRSSSATKSFLFRAAFVLTFFVGLYYFYRQFGSQYPGVTILVEGILIFGGRHHQVAQSKGISILYDSKYSSEVSREHPFYKWSIRSMSMFGISSGFFSFLTLNTYKTNSPLYDYATQSFVSPALSALWFGTGIISLACLIFLTIAAHKIYRPGYRRKKIMFNLRFPIKLMSYHSSVAAAFSNGTHGIEYLSVYQKYDEHNERTWSKRTFIVTLAIATASFVVLRYLNAYSPFLKMRNHPELVSLGISIIQGLTFLHYFLDAHLFLQRDPNSKTFIFESLRK